MLTDKSILEESWEWAILPLNEAKCSGYPYDFNDRRMTCMQCSFIITCFCRWAIWSLTCLSLVGIGCCQSKLILRKTQHARTVWESWKSAYKLLTGWIIENLSCKVRLCSWSLKLVFEFHLVGVSAIQNVNKTRCNWANIAKPEIDISVHGHNLQNWVALG